VTIPAFVHQEGTERLAALPKPPDHKERWNAEAERLRSGLKDRVLGGFPPRVPLAVDSLGSEAGISFRITTEPGIRATGVAIAPARAGAGTAVIVIPGPKTQPSPGPNVRELSRPWLERGFATLTVTDSRVTPLEVTNVDPVAGLADHNPAEWGLWINRPLLGQWTWDLIRWLDFLDERPRIRARISGERGDSDIWKPSRPYVLVGFGSMSLPAILAGGLDPRVYGVACERCLVSYVTRERKPWSGHPMGLVAPNILELGDVSHLASLLAPRPFVLTSAIEPDGDPADCARIRAAFDFTRRIYELMGAAEQLKLGEPADPTIFAGKS
jgi:hypothetical protein